MVSLLVARFEARTEVTSIERAAAAGEIVRVTLDAPPPPGLQILQLFVREQLVGSFWAEAVGSGEGGEYPLRVRAEEGPREALPSLVSSSFPPPPDVPVAAVGVRAIEEMTLTSRALTPLPRWLLDDAVSEDATVPLTRAVGQRMRAEPLLPSDGSDGSDGDEAAVQGREARPVAADTSWNVRVAPSTGDPLCGRTICGGKYVLHSVIGVGAIGIVFKALHCELGRTVAIKVLTPSLRGDATFLDLFHAEARAASLLEHPHVARVYDYGHDPDGLVYMVMEYLSGYTLGSVLEARRRLSPGRAVDVMIQVCAALSAAHDRGIVHRDVKPDNIVLVPAQDDEGDPVEIVKVCDFGISALGSGSEEGAAVGTPEYMPPEQTTGLAVKPSADVYSCGVVLYEMLAGEVPFTSDQAYRILMKHRSELPRPPSCLAEGIPRELEAVILRCLEKSPAKRYQSARQLRVELRRTALEAKP